jgi:hypothetical protein
MPELEGHWLEHFLSKASYDQPKITANFFMKRVEIVTDKRNENKFNYRPFNYAVYLTVPFRFYETQAPILIMESLREWIRDQMEKTSQNKWFRKYSSKLFFTMFDPCHGGVMEFLYSWANSGLQSDLRIIMDILTIEPNDFVIHNPKFITSVLQRAEKFSQECVDEFIELLVYSAVTGTRGGTFGEPYPKDLFLKSESIKILETLSPISPAYRVYEEILACCNESIGRNKRDKERFIKNNSA